MVVGESTLNIFGNPVGPIPFSGHFILNKDGKIHYHRVYGDVNQILIAVGLEVTADADGKPITKPRKQE